MLGFFYKNEWIYDARYIWMGDNLSW
jgi:hypothetical protein